MATSTTTTAAAPAPDQTEASQAAAAAAAGGEGDQLEEGERARTPREVAMDRIERENELRIDADHVEQGQAAVVAANAGEDTGADGDQVTQQLAVEAVGKPNVLDKDLDKLFVRQKIDGVERLVSVADMQRESQMDGAARTRLEEAAALRRQAETLLINARAQTTAPPVRLDDEGKPADSTSHPEDPDAKAKDSPRGKFLTAMFEGDFDGALHAMDDIGVGRPAPTPTELARTLTPAVKQQLAVESALEGFQKDFNDIVVDPHLASIADEFLEEETKVPNQSFAQALTNAGMKTRDWLKQTAGVKPPTGATTTTERTKKLENKASIDNVQALNVTATTTEEPVQTHSQIIQEMRKQRGLIV